MLQQWQAWMLRALLISSKFRSSLSTIYSYTTLLWTTSWKTNRTALAHFLLFLIALSLSLTLSPSPHQNYTSFNTSLNEFRDLCSKLWELRYYLSLLKGTSLFYILRWLKITCVFAAQSTSMTFIHASMYTYISLYTDACIVCELFSLMK